MARRVHRPHLNRESMPWAREIDQAITTIENLLDANRSALLATNRGVTSTARRVQQVTENEIGAESGNTRASEVGVPIEGGTTEACGLMTSGIVVDVTDPALITGMRFLIDSPPTSAAYRIECWLMEDLILTERIGMTEGVSAISGLDGTKTWMEISGSWGHGEKVAWVVEPGKRYALLITRISGVATDLYMTSATAPEIVEGLGAVQLHAHVNEEAAAGVALELYAGFQSRVAILTETVPPHSHDVIDITGVGAIAGQVPTFDGTRTVWQTPTGGGGGEPEVLTVGNTVGSNSGSTYAAATTGSLTVGESLTLKSLTFHAVEADTYTLSIDSVAITTVAATAGAEATFAALDVPLATGSHIVSIQGTAARRVRYASVSEISYQGEGVAMTSAGWAEFPGNYSLPWAYTVEVTRDPAPPPTPQEAHFSYQGDLAVIGGSQRLHNASGNDRTITKVALGLGTAPTGADAIVDVNVDSVSIFAAIDRPKVAAGANFGEAASATTWPVGSYLTVDIDQVGSTVAGSDLTVTVMYS